MRSCGDTTCPVNDGAGRCTAEKASEACGGCPLPFLAMALGAA